MHQQLVKHYSIDYDPCLTLSCTWLRFNTVRCAETSSSRYYCYDLQSPLTEQSDLNWSDARYAPLQALKGSLSSSKLFANANQLKQTIQLEF